MQSLSLQGYYSQPFGTMNEVMRGNKRARGVVGNVMYGNKYMVKWMAQRSGLTLADIIHSAPAPAPAPIPPPLYLSMGVETVYEAADVATGLKITWEGNESESYLVTATIDSPDGGGGNEAFRAEVSGNEATWTDPALDQAYIIRVFNVTTMATVYAPVTVDLPLIAAPTAVLVQEQTDDVSGRSLARLEWAMPANAQLPEGTSCSLAYLSSFVYTMGGDGPATWPADVSSPYETAWVDVTDAMDTFSVYANGTNATQSPTTTLTASVPAGPPVSVQLTFQVDQRTATVTFSNPDPQPLSTSGHFDIYVTRTSASADPIDTLGYASAQYDSEQGPYTVEVTVSEDLVNDESYTAYVRLVSEVPNLITDQESTSYYLNGQYAFDSATFIL